MAQVTDVFVYGTLQFPEVLRALIGRQPECAPATLHGFRRYCVQGHVFPAIVPSQPDETVPGYILYGILPHEMKIFDAFEDEEYVKTAGTVRNASIKQDERVLYYVWHPSLENKLDRRDWDPDHFRTEHLHAYEQMCKQFAKDLRPWKQW